ncbi:hypothetical protein [Synoicihabitans lomoniglobus]|uniref:Uncharacterized protein n=1 Tax=Synoicihabitans lomoniglobus TaxID=2909285 RepID=A0AAE9ZYF2_9BACT|nr:hypothetical protein [Opitutaceae bacterium LMO-M01]WED64883.1 hypothetical protein PXH66_21260 [Opitutaceae bacterium LMO-M01]
MKTRPLPPHSSGWWIRLVLFAVTWGVGRTVAADEGDSSLARARSDVMTEDQDIEIRGVFEGVLPRTTRKNALRLVLHPHFGDFHRKRYLRAPIGLRYGLTDNWDVAAAVEGYVSHGLDGVAAFSEMGFSQLEVATKYRSDWTMVPGWDMGVRLKYTHPLDHPPVELTDGFAHVVPSLTFAREIAGWPGAEMFWGTGLDLLRESSVVGSRDENEFGDHANTFVGGLVWQQGTRVYTFEATYATTALIGDFDSQHRIQLRPGVIFRIPDRFTFHSRGDWRMGVAAKFIYGPDGPEWGLSVKFRGNFDLKKMIRRN